MARRLLRIVLGAVLAATGSAALASCSASRIKPTAIVHISGRVVSSTGVGIPGVHVLMLREVDLGQALFGGLIAVGTLSAVCYLPDPPAVCDRARRTTTDAHGDYAFTLTGQDTQGSFGTAATLDVVLDAGPGSASLRFTADRAVVHLPVVHRQRPGAAVTREGRVLSIGADPVAATAGSDATYGVRFLQGTDVVWSQPLDGRHGRIDTRVLEDLRARPVIVVDTRLAGGAGAGDVRAEYTGPALGPVRGPGAPPSRGRPCSAVTGTSPTAVFPSAACAFTDGDLFGDARLSAGGKVVDGVVVDLGRVRPVGLVVVRGFAGQVVVELSGDGRHYTTAATLNANASPIAVDITGRARFVRVRAPSGLDESLATEVSVW
jgi:hypothetical protein